MIFNFYIITDKKPHCVYSIENNDFSLEDLDKPKKFEKSFIDYYYSKLCFNDNFMNLLNTKRPYYISTDNNKIIGIMVLHKGYTFINCTNFDYRELLLNGLVLPPTNGSDNTDNNCNCSCGEIKWKDF